MPVSGMTSTSPAGAAAGAAAAAAGAASARSTSSATMRPSGPVPRSERSSMPFSRAMRRASGEALTRPPSSACGSEAAAGASGSSGRPFSDLGAASFGSSFSSAGSSFASGSASGTSSPSSPMTAMALPTSISSPSPARILSRTPEESASTSWVTFSVSSS
jgi:hypothetical protein